MNCKKKVWVILIMFLIGIAFIFCGFSFGESTAKMIAKATWVTTWETSKGKLMACIYTPVIVGIYFLIVSLMLIYKWLEDIISEIYR